MYRGIELKEGFYKDSIGPILAFDSETDEAIALLPMMVPGYSFIDPKTRKKEILTGRTNPASRNRPIVSISRCR